VAINCYASRGVAGGEGASGSTRPGAQALGAHQHTFFSHLKRVLSRNFGQSICLKMRIFLQNNCKNRLSVGGSAPETRLLLQLRRVCFWR